MQCEPGRGNCNRIEGRVDEPKGDPGNSLSRAELEDKALRLAAYRNGASAAEMRGVIARIWVMETAPVVSDILPFPQQN